MKKTPENFTFDYSEKSDILNIHRKEKKTHGSAEMSDFTLDFDRDGNVIGIEIVNASEFFSQLEISKDQLMSIQHAELMLQHKGNYVFITVKLLLPQHVEKIIPIPAPVLAGMTA